MIEILKNLFKDKYPHEVTVITPSGHFLIWKSTKELTEGETKAFGEFLKNRGDKRVNFLDAELKFVDAFHPMTMDKF